MSTTLGKAIREARLSHGMSMGQLAGSVGRTAAAVRLWERDEAVPGNDVLEKLADVLELDPGDLTGLATAEPTAEEPVDDPFAGRSGGQTGMSPIPSAAAETALTAPVSAGVETRDWQQIWRDVRDPDGPYLGYVRATLVVVIGIIMLWILAWAVGELFDLLGQVWDSLDTDEDVVDALGTAARRLG